MADVKAGKVLLEVKNLKTYFYTDDGVVKAVDGVDFHVNAGEVLGLVGESGCGKSVTSFSILRLVGSPGKIVDGKIFFAGRELLTLPEEEMVKMRGDRISMIFQQPQSSLNPVFTVGDQVAEVLQIHQGMSKDESWKRAVDLLVREVVHRRESRLAEEERQRAERRVQNLRRIVRKALSEYSRLQLLRQ